MKAVKDFFVEFGNEIGYHSISDFMENVFFFSNKIFVLAITTLSFWLGLEVVLSEIVFNPIRVYYTFVGLTIAESIIGTLRAIYAEKQKFSMFLAMRIVPKILAHTFLLSAAWNMAKSTQWFDFLPYMVFAYFAWHNFLKTIYHLIGLKLIQGGFANWIKDKIEINEIFKTNKKDEPNN